MTRVRTILDGREVYGRADQTIQQVCEANGIEIPTLCHDRQLKPQGSCGICVVDVQGYGLVASCATRVADGMIIQTNSASVVSARKRRLAELLDDHYGDCVAPCQLACPAGVDAQGYIALIARGAYKAAVGLISETLPLAAVIGRICPRPCEKACRRSLVDQPIAICSLKRFAADDDLSSQNRYVPAKKPGSGFRVAIVGSGPAGLSAAYYLAQMGHGVTILESLPQPGGMLRYGIPDYRLPKDILDQEIARIARLGATIKTTQTLGKDFALADLLRDGFHAIFLAIGAHQNQRMNVEGEDLRGILPGVSFLRTVAQKGAVEIGQQVAVIGGGNTAIDAARSALRLGAQEVTLVYRRSRAEMPATHWEVEEAEEEGIRLRFLAAPLRVTGRDGKVSALECIRMALGERDASGRPRPQPIPGSEFTLPVDSVIVAIGQRPDLSFLGKEKDLGIEGGNIVADPASCQTSIKRVFSGGDCVTGPATAVEAIAAGRRAALSIDRYLQGEELRAVKVSFNISKGQLSELSGDRFAQFERQPRQMMRKLSAEVRRRTLQEIELGFTEDMARREAERCLECGCKAAHDCALRQYSAEYGIASMTARRNGHFRPVDGLHPFVERDPNKCIACGRCIRICREVQGIGALGLAYRVATANGRDSLLETTCVSCGQCVASCPVGALVSKKGLHPAKEVKTICPYCGVGCGIYLGVREGVIVDVRGDPDSPANKGNLCVKGRFGYEYVHHPDRLTSPLIRRDGELVPATWDEALNLVATRLGRYKGDEFAAISSAKCTTEENYVFQKFARLVMGTNNIDHCARLCHAPSVAALALTLGSGAMTNSISDIGQAACIFVIGNNTTATHPVTGLEIVKAVKNGVKLIVANPRKIDLCRFGHLWLQHRPGSDVALLMGMMRVIVEESLLDAAFIEKRCENFAAFQQSLSSFELNFVEQVTGVSQQRIVEAARLYAREKPGVILWGMGVTQHSHGTDNALAISNLALLTGNIGKPFSGLSPLRGQNNVQGASDMGALPNVYPGYQPVDNGEVKKKFESAWGGKLSEKPGLTMGEILQAAYQRQIKALYLVGENPALSEPCSRHAQGALEELEFLVVQDIFLTETARLAHVVLPAVTFAEKDGTFTNTERRVQLVRKAIEPLGDSRPDWWIICEVAKRLGVKGFDYRHPAEIMAEIASVTPSYKGITFGRLENGGIQWPCPDQQHPGTPTLHTERFPTGNGKARFMPLGYKPPAETPDDHYPFVLTTERLLYHYHSGSMTRRVKGLMLLRSEEVVEINPKDAAALGVADGDWVQVISRRGEVTVRAKATEASPPGVVSMSFHFPETPTNVLTNPAVDPISKTPELKVCAVRIQKVKGP